MRTVKRQTRELNPGKERALRSLVTAFAAEKRLWLDRFAQRDHRALIQQHRQVRDAAIKDGYVPKSGLQARMWKLALVDAAQTWDKFWQAMFVEVRSAVGRRHDFNEADRHYAFWLLSGYTQFFACLDGTAPVPKFLIEPDRRTKVMHFVQRKIRKLRGRNPMIRTARSAVFDANCYNTFEEAGVQYVKLMGLEPKKRIALPLLGRTAISGNIRLVLDETNVAHVHIGYDLHPAKLITPESGVIALDTGYTEAFVDTEGNAYGKGRPTTLIPPRDVS